MESVIKPWGGFTPVANILGSNIKTITVKSGHRLSLQSHKKRSELWTVLAGTIIVETRDSFEDKPWLEVLGEGDIAKIGVGELHRMSCYGVVPAVILEVSFGEFDEEDITRYEDDYGREGTSTI